MMQVGAYKIKSKRTFAMIGLAALVVACCVPGCSRSKGHSSDSKKKKKETATSVEKTTTAKPAHKVTLADAVGKRAPEIDLEVTFGWPGVDKMTLAQLRGKVVVLDYWATW